MSIRRKRGSVTTELKSTRKWPRGYKPRMNKYLLRKLAPCRFTINANNFAESRSFPRMSEDIHPYETRLFGYRTLVGGVGELVIFALPGTQEQVMCVPHDYSIQRVESLLTQWGLLKQTA